MKFKLRGLVILIIALSTNNSLAQGTNSSKFKYVKLFVNGSYLYSTDPILDMRLSNDLTGSWEKNNYDFGYISIAVELKNKNRLNHEFELMPIRFSVNDERKIIKNNQSPENYIINSGGKTTTIETYFSHQFNINFKDQKKWDPMISFSTRFFYNYLSYTPAISTTYPISSHKFGLLFSIVPVLKRELSEEFAIELNIPLHYYEISLDSKNKFDPAISEDNRNEKNIKGDFIPNRITIKFGVVYRFGLE